MQVKKKQLELGHGTMDWFQIGKGVHQGCIWSPCLFNLYVIIASEMPCCMKHKLESTLLGETSITSDMQMTPPNGRMQRVTKEPLNECERGECKIWLKTQHSKN